MSASAPRLLYVVNEAYFFLTHRLGLAEAAQASGYEVEVAAPADHVWAPAGFSTGEIEKRGFRCHAIPLSRRGRNPFADLRTLGALARLYRTRRPELVHHLTIKPVLYGGIAARLTGVPAVVSSVTGLGRAFTAKGAGAAAVRRGVLFLYRRATAHPNLRVIVQTAADGSALVEEGAVRADRIVHIPGSGVDLAEFVPQPEPDGTPVVVLAARLLWEKGVGEFVEAAALLRRRGAAARFALVGDTRPGVEGAVAPERIEAWVREGTVEWWGRRDDMPDVLAACQVFCLPSRYGEGVPKVLLEAAACGRPLVATDIPGCRAVVRGGENGLLVPPGDAGALADALQTLLADPAARRRMGERSRTIAAEFDVRTVIDRTLGVYASVSNAASA